MSSSPSVFSPRNAGSPTVPGLEVGCCCRTAASGFPHDPQHKHPLDPLCHLNTHANTVRERAWAHTHSISSFWVAFAGVLPAVRCWKDAPFLDKNKIRERFSNLSFNKKANVDLYPSLIAYSVRNYHAISPHTMTYYFIKMKLQLILYQ